MSHVAAAPAAPLQRIRAQAGQVAETMLTAPESEGEEAAAAAE